MKLERRIGDYLRKFRGTTTSSPPRVRNAEIFWSWIGVLLGIGLLAWLGHQFFSPHDLPLVASPLGATAVMLFGAPKSPMAQPRNVLGGHVVSALVGVLCWRLFHDYPVLTQALAVATAAAAMHMTRTLHPPGGGTALIAVIGGPQIHTLGFLYVLIPATIGPLILIAIALIVNNLPRSRRYPEFWF